VSIGHYENFPVASRLVPARLRPAVVAIYRFARAADDIADEGDAAIGNDSGLTHLAAVVGTPTLALFGPTDPARTAPSGRAAVLQPPAPGSGRLDRLAPTDVAAAGAWLLELGPAER
jgi:hypothetical protein